MGYNKKIFNDETYAADVMAYLYGCEQMEQEASLDADHIGFLLTMISSMQDTIDKQKKELTNKQKRRDCIDTFLYANEALRTFDQTDTVTNHELIIIDKLKDRIKSISADNESMFIELFEPGKKL